MLENTTPPAQPKRAPRIYRGQDVVPDFFNDDYYEQRAFVQGRNGVARLPRRACRQLPVPEGVRGRTRVAFHRHGGAREELHTVHPGEAVPNRLPGIPVPPERG